MAGLRDGMDRLRRLMYPPWRDPMIALIAFGGSMIYLASGLSDLLWADSRVDADQPWTQVFVLAASSALELGRARRPVVMLLSGIAIAATCVLWLGTSLPLLLILSDLLFAAVLYGRRGHSRAIITSIGALVPVGAILAYVLTEDWRLAAVILLTLLLAPTTTVWWAMQVRLHRDIAENERERARQLERLAELDRRAAVQGERARMARDLHDVVAGHLSAIALQSEALLSMYGNGAAADSRGVATDPVSYDSAAASDSVRDVVSSVRENSVQALTEMRAMIGLLRGDEGPEEQSAPRISDVKLLVESARAAGVDLRVRIDELPDVPRAVELAGYRIVQEALTNVVKHSGTAEATLAVRFSEGNLAVEVTNRTESASESPLPGVGWETMRQRAEAVNGTLAVGPSEENTRTWVVRAWLPLDSSPANGPDGMRSADGLANGRERFVGGERG